MPGRARRGLLEPDGDPLLGGDHDGGDRDVPACSCDLALDGEIPRERRHVDRGDSRRDRRRRHRCRGPRRSLGGGTRPDRELRPSQHRPLRSEALAAAPTAAPRAGERRRRLPDDRDLLRPDRSPRCALGRRADGGCGAGVEGQLRDPSVRERGLAPRPLDPGRHRPRGHLCAHPERYPSGGPPSPLELARFDDSAPDGADRGGGPREPRRARSAPDAEHRTPSQRIDEDVPRGACEPDRTLSKALRFGDEGEDA